MITSTFLIVEKSYLRISVLGCTVSLLMLHRMGKRQKELLFSNIILRSFKEFFSFSFAKKTMFKFLKLPYQINMHSVKG